MFHHSLLWYPDIWMPVLILLLFEFIFKSSAATGGGYSVFLRLFFNPHFSYMFPIPDIKYFKFLKL